MMITITTTEKLNISLLDDLCRDTSAYCDGMGQDTHGTRIPLDDATPQAEQDTLQAILDGAATATVISDKATIAADSVEVATVSATVDITNTEALVTVFGSDYLKDFEETVPVTAGQCSYQFTTGLPGNYSIRFYGIIAHDSGYCQVVAT